MRVGDSSMGGDAGQFQTTRWTLKAFIGMGKSRPEASYEEAAKAPGLSIRSANHWSPPKDRWSRENRFRNHL
jgi:hypothetical protein